MDTFIPEETKKWAIQNALRVLVAYNRTCIKIKIQCRCARKQNPAFDLLCTFVDNVIAAIVTLFIYVTCDKIEPDDPVWVSFCKYIHSVNGMKALTSDDYENVIQNDIGEWSNDTDVLLDPNGRFYPIIRNSYSSAKTYNQYNIENGIVIAKICPAASIIRLAKNVDVEKDLTELKSSSARFLEIEYKCGDLNSLEIEVPKTHYFAGNELLSKTYVLRYLEHLPIYTRWKFDESEYELRIVDEDSEVFSLNSNQYVRLEQDGYRIVDISTPIEPVKQVQIEEDETKESIYLQREQSEEN
jgi:hypothetical protein